MPLVYLTFDGGPSPYTGRFLDALEAGHARASFFRVGRRPAGQQAQARRALARGMAVGDHTWSHPQLTGLDEAAQLDQLRRTQEAFHTLLGVTPGLVRPPYELFDAGTCRAAAPVSSGPAPSAPATSAPSPAPGASAPPGASPSHP